MTYQNAAPFIGAVLAGVFTDGALTQLRSLGFTILYFPYATVVSAFSRVGVDAHFEEDTPDSEFARQVRTWEALSPQQRNRVAKALVKINSEEVRRFMNALEHGVTRQIELVRVIPLHGTTFEWKEVGEAIAFIESYDEASGSKPIVKYEIEICYNNGDRINGQFANKGDALQFLRTYQPLVLRPVTK
jgi:hypothetical protein